MVAGKQPLLQLRGGVYRFRIRVPDELRPLVGKTEITKSLGTGDLREAQALARLERVKLDGEWAALRRRLSPEPKATLSEAEIWQLVSKWFVEAERKRVAAPGETDYDTAVEDLAMVSTPGVINSSVFIAAKRMLEEEGIKLDPATPAFGKLQQMLHRAYVESERREIVRAFPGTSMTLDPTFAAPASTPFVKPVSLYDLKKVMKAVASDPARSKLSGKSLIKRDAQWRALKEFFGPTTVMDDIGRDRIRKFMDLLKELPSNASKHFPAATLAEAVALGAKKGLPTLSPDTANAYLRQLGSLFRFAVNEGMAKSDPTAGLLLPKSGVKAKDKRLPFSTADLKAIFAAPIYTGCVDDQSGYAKVGPNIVRAGRFLVPLIALYTGMRLGEICQLTLDDSSLRSWTGLHDPFLICWR